MLKCVSEKGKQAHLRDQRHARVSLPDKHVTASSINIIAGTAADAMNPRQLHDHELWPWRWPCCRRCTQSCTRVQRCDVATLVSCISQDDGGWRRGGKGEILIVWGKWWGGGIGFSKIFNCMFPGVKRAPGCLWMWQQFICCEIFDVGLEKKRLFWQIY